MSLNKSLLSQITEKMKKPSKPKIARNQWQHPGEITNIPSNNITMQGVGFPVLGVPNAGAPQMMMPGQDYNFPGADNVTEYPMMGKGGYVVTRSRERKGKTHKVTGPDGTVKFFGDSKMGQHPGDPERKKAFYARHKKNLERNPYFRAFARATWAEGGEFDQMQGGGLWDTNKTAWVDSVNRANMDKNFVQRMYDKNAPQMFLPGSKEPSTHYMESGDGRAYPTVVQRPGNKFLEWLNQNNPDAAAEYAHRTGQYIQFPNDTQATWYGQNGYKKGTGVVTGKKQSGGEMLEMAQKGGEKKKSIRDKNGYIDIAKHFPEVGDNTIDADWVEKAEMLNQMYPGSRFICTAKGCADIATSYGRAKGFDFGRNNAWQLGNQNPVVWTNPKYEGQIGNGLLSDPTNYGVPAYLTGLDEGYLVGLNRTNNSLDSEGRRATGAAAKAKSTKDANDSGDYGPRLYPDSRGYEHIGYVNAPGQMVHGTAAGKGHPSYLIFDNIKDGIKLNGIGRYDPVEVMEEPGFLQQSANFLKNMFQSGGSIYDFMTSRGMDGSFSSRKKLFDKYFDGKYTGSSAQNQAMLAMLQGAQQASATRRPAPQQRPLTPNERRAIRKSNMIDIEGEIDNRNWFQRTMGMDEDEVQKYKFQVPRDVAQFYNQYKDKNKGKKFGIVSKQNARGYFFDENGNLALQDEVGLGSDAGDDQPIFYKKKTTPSGAYTMKRATSIGNTTDLAKAYGSNNFFTIQHTDPNKRLLPDPANPNRVVSAAVHGVPVSLEKDRLQAFGNNNLDDNRMSAGCINCRKQTLDNPYFTNIPQNMDMFLYVTPEKKNGGSTFSGNAWYQKGGENDSTLENIIEVFDPTGISSWDDVYRSAVDPNSKWYDTAIEVIGAVPMAGKLGKLTKAGIHLKKYSGLEKALFKALPQNAAVSKSLDGLGLVGRTSDAYQTAQQAPGNRFLPFKKGGQTRNEREMTEGIADILSQVQDPQNRAMIAKNMMADFQREKVTYNPMQFLTQASVMAYGGVPCFECGGMMAEGGEMIRRADGSYSQRGLWDNIRANRGSGKKPTKQMLEQERKIRAQEKAFGGQFNIGDEMEVTPEQLAELKRQGYTFEVI